ncbi:MAG: hypothetical protein OEV28_14290, partial [Nitrospirota bacterium]|nr:hypothetical protein [Nitrospirota bacterium]
STEEHFCYQCHSKDSEGSSDYNPNGASSDAKDAYRVEPMRQMAIKIKNMFESGKKSFHPINGKSPYDSLNGLSSAAGKHKVDEWMSLPTNVQTANWNPASSRHVECTDCHNPHAASKEPRNLITWRPNPFDPTGGSFGGQVGGANKGVWGIEPTYDSSGWKAPTKFTVLETSENMYQFCFKCHSAYAYGAGSSYSIPATAPSPPQIPMGKLSSTSSGSSWGGSYGGSSSGSWASGPETDMSVEFNPNNYGFHPILRRGRNQPKPHLNSAWPYFNGGDGNGKGWQIGSSSYDTSYRWGGGMDDSYYSSTPSGFGHVSYNAATKTVTIADGRDFPTYYMQPGWKIQFGTDRPSSSATWYEIKTVDSGKQITLVSGPSSSLSDVSFVTSAGLGWAFVPPYGPWSTITCADCHSPSDENDPAGPHGSDNPWLLRNVDTKAKVDNNLDGDTDDPEDMINDGSWGNPRMFCYSCHRRDVYGVKAAGGSSYGGWGGWGDGAGGEPGFNSGTYSHMRYSRLNSHPPMSVEMSGNKWGVWCMNCHGGDSMGGLHGSNKSSSSSSGGWSGGGSTPMGVRLRNGAAVTGHSISSGGGSCSWGNATSFSSCSGWSGSASYSANYNYTGVE